MVPGGLSLLRCALSAILVGVLLLVSPLRAVPSASGLPTPAGVVILEAGAVAPAPTALPRGWLALASVPASQIASVPVLGSTQGAALPNAGVTVVRADPSQVEAAREAVATRWAVESGSLQWHPRGGLLGVFAMAVAFVLGARRWSERAGVLVGLTGLTVGLAASSVWVPASVLLVLPVAWLVADVSYAVGMYAWAEARIASRPTRRPASAPTPLPVANR